MIGGSAQSHGEINESETMKHSNHSALRAAQRGLGTHFIGAILEHADVECPIGDNCTLMRVSRRHAARLNIDDRLGRYGLIWSEDTARIVTILPLHEGPAGRRYRRSI